MATATPVVDKQQPKEVSAAEQHQQWLDTLEPEDIVTVLRRGWGSPENPSEKVDYFDGMTFVGCVGRNVPWSLARKWLKLRLIDQAHIFENNATQADFSQATGRSPLSPGSLAAALAKVTPERLIAILGEQQALALSKEAQRLITSRQTAEEA